MENTEGKELPQDIKEIKELNDSIRYFNNRARYCAKQEESFKEYRMDILAEKAAHTVDIARASVKRLEYRREKILMLLN